MPVTEMGTPWRVYTLSLFTFKVRVFREILEEKEAKHAFQTDVSYRPTYAQGNVKTDTVPLYLLYTGDHKHSPTRDHVRRRAAEP